MESNAYRDVLTLQDLCNVLPRLSESPLDAINRLRDERLQALLNRSGAKNVSNAVICRWHDPRMMVDVTDISFNSRSWTG